MAAPSHLGAGAQPDALFDATGFLDAVEVGSPRPRALNFYYGVKPLIPRAAQLAARRAYARLQRRRGFPAWPIEPLRVEQMKEAFRAELAATGNDRIPFLNFWPGRSRCALIVTHDVEGAAGMNYIPEVLELEARYGLRSSWNFVADDYAIDPEIFAAVRAAGGEIGLHGLHHNGLLFADRESFTAQLPRIHEVMRDWGAVGFRSPATHREPSWMPELGCSYDSSFPDTDPFEPQPEGCCAIWPFFLDELVELPITMPQDHTLFTILRQTTIETWVDKSRWLAANHGLINVLVHPDYLLDPRELSLYEELLAHLVTIEDCWHALPCEVASWWRTRSRLQQLSATDVEVQAREFSASVAYACPEGDDIVFDTSTEDGAAVPGANLADLDHDKPATAPTGGETENGSYRSGGRHGRPTEPERSTASGHLRREK
jgi:peptidoglycan/xylan/chitin deacetylase (PgdA/CDA1 family)